MRYRLSKNISIDYFADFVKRFRSEGAVDAYMEGHTTVDFYADVIEYCARSCYTPSSLPTYSAVMNYMLCNHRSWWEDLSSNDRNLNPMKPGVVAYN